MKRELILEGLDCAHCASKIETKVKNISGIKTANLDFITKKLSFEVTNNDEINNIIEQIKKIIKDLEPDVIIVEEPSNAPNSNKFDLIKLITGGGIYAIAFVFSSNFYLQLSLFIISYLIVGHEVILKALKNIKKGQIFDENFLMFIATLGAFAIKEFPEGVAVMLFYQVGELFQDMAVNHSRKSISALMDIRPDFANLKTPDGIKKVNPQQIKIGDIIIIKPGEKVPLDGKILDGNGMVDTSALTGESIPKNLKSGDEILSGFINKNALLTVEVTKAFGESTVSKILDLVQNASSKKATTENFITKFARYYTPAVVIIAFTLAVLPPLLLNADFSQWLYRALVFLVISCPCALVISIPLSFFGGIGGASKKGILVKGGNYLEALNDAEIIIFDKTGTLTKGVFNVTTIENKNGFSKEELLKYAAHAESYSNHPIATSIVKYYNNPINKNHIKDYNEISGNGIKANVIGKQVLVGNLKLMKKENIHFVNVDTSATVVHVAIDNVYAGYIIIADEIKPDSKIAVRHLKKIGIKNIAMLTGDNKTVATEIAKELEVDTVYSELLPYEKVEKLELLDKQKSQKGKLIFVGDGINDAPVLARADIGIAMGGLGSDAAIEAADIVLMTDEPKKIVTAVKIAKKTRKIVLQNIILALGIKFVVLILGAGGIATMWEAVFADVGVAIIAILNAMRVMNVKNI